MTFFKFVVVLAVSLVFNAGAASAQAPAPILAPSATAQTDNQGSTGVTVPLDLMPSALNSKENPDAPEAQQKLLAGEAYVEADIKELLQTYVMLDGVDIKDPEIIAHYASIFYCSLFKEKYKNDFEWNALREQISSRFSLKKEHYRSLYEMSGVIYLGRYNFDTQDFPLIGESSMFNVGSMIMLQGQHPRNCMVEGRPLLTIFPTTFMLYLKQPFTLDRIKMPMDEAEKLLQRMEREKNTERKLFIRFRSKLQSLYAGKPAGSNTVAAFLGELTAVDVFFDRDMTEYIASIPID